MSKNYLLSQTQLDIIEKLKQGWYLQHDIITFMWQIKNEKTGMAERINKNSVNLLLEKNIIERVATKKEHYFGSFNLYTLKQ